MDEGEGNGLSSGGNNLTSGSVICCRLAVNISGGAFVFCVGVFAGLLRKVFMAPTDKCLIISIFWGEKFEFASRGGHCNDGVVAVLAESIIGA